VNACAGRLVSSPWWVTIVTMSSIVQATAAQQLSHSLFEMPVGVSDLGWTKFELFCGDIHESVSKTGTVHKLKAQTLKDPFPTKDERWGVRIVYRFPTRSLKIGVMCVFKISVIRHPVIMAHHSAKRTHRVQ
jgi:hypothetical protein